MIHDIIKTYPELSKIAFSSLNENTSKLDKKIYQIQISRKGQNIRIGNEVDKPKIESILKKFKKYQSAPLFTALDYQSDNTINIPLGFTCFHFIKKMPNYYQEYNQDIKHYGNLFWRGDITTHETRKIILNYFKKKDYGNFDTNHWRPSAGRFYAKACTENEYNRYFNQLKSFDCFLVIRGDKPWTHSFFDCLRANTIPVCIGTFYNKLGWHKIGYKIEDLFLDFDTKKDSLEKIAYEIQELLKNKEKVLHMKENLLNFYTNTILQDKFLSIHGASTPFSGWGNTIKSKLLQIHNNDYQLTDNYLFT